MRKGIVALGFALCVVLLAATAFVYGGARTAFVDTVGFTLTGVFRSLFLCSVFVGPGALAALLIAWIARGRDAAADLAIAFVVAGLLGCAAGEVFVLIDDARFADEVAVDPTVPHDPPRPWPYGDSALVYIPGEGTHATD